MKNEGTTQVHEGTARVLEGTALRYCSKVPLMLSDILERTACFIRYRMRVLIIPFSMRCSMLTFAITLVMCLIEDEDLQEVAVLLKSSFGWGNKFDVHVDSARYKAQFLCSYHILKMVTFKILVREYKAGDEDLMNLSKGVRSYLMMLTTTISITLKELRIGSVSHLIEA
ncbi:hypothetical protein Tco_0276493 [Tanacetum coccineum]